MAQQRRDVGAPLWGVFLLFLGVVFLLQALDILPWGLWRTLWRFWPVLIIIIGLGVILRHRNPWLIALIFLVMLVASLFVAIRQYETPSPLPPSNYSQALGNLESAQAKIDFNAGNLTLGALPSSSVNLVEAQDGGISANFSTQGREGILSLSTGRERRPGDVGLNIKLSRAIPLKLDVKSAASNVDLDLSELKTTELRLNIDAGNCKARLSPTGKGTAYVKSAVANVDIIIPNGVSARVKAKTTLSAFTIDERRFPKKDDFYISPDFDTAQNRIDLDINSDLGRVDVK